MEGDQAQQREAYKQRVGEVVQVPFMRRLGRRGRLGGGTGAARDGGAWWLPSVGSHRVGHD